MLRSSKKNWHWRCQGQKFAKTQCDHTRTCFGNTTISEALVNFGPRPFWPTRRSFWPFAGRDPVGSSLHWPRKQHIISWHVLGACFFDLLARHFFRLYFMLWPLSKTKQFIRPTLQNALAKFPAVCGDAAEDIEGEWVPEICTHNPPLLSTWYWICIQVWVVHIHVSQYAQGLNQFGLAVCWWST